MRVRKLHIFYKQGIKQKYRWLESLIKFKLQKVKKSEAVTQQKHVFCKTKLVHFSHSFNFIYFTFCYNSCNETKYTRVEWNSTPWWTTFYIKCNQLFEILFQFCKIVLHKQKSKSLIITQWHNKINT